MLHERAAGVAHRVFAHELLLMLLYGVSCWLVGRRIPILRAEFSYAEPAHSAEYRLMYCADLRFNRPNTLLAFEASYLDLPVVQNERSVKEFLRTAPESILLKYKNGSSLSARVRRRLRQCLPGEVPDFEGLAAEMNMTPATLAPPAARGGRFLPIDQGSVAPGSRHQLSEPLQPQRHGYRRGIGILRAQRISSCVSQMDRRLSRANFAAHCRPERPQLSEVSRMIFDGILSGKVLVVTGSDGASGPGGGRDLGRLWREAALLDHRTSAAAADSRAGVLALWRGSI